MKIAFSTLGCKVNWAETERLIRESLKLGFQVVSTLESPDVLVVNTCTVTTAADAKARQLLRHLHHLSPETKIVATGCYAQRDPETLRAINGVSMVVPNNQKNSIPAFLAERANGSKTEGCSTKQLRTRAFVKVQDGCSQGCIYCIVPKVRGTECSFAVSDIVGQIIERGREGFHEVVLTGINIGRYYWRNMDLSDLVSEILASTNISRLRLTSLHPYEFTSRLLAVFQDSRLCPHLHLPLQSGSDRVLKAMGRRYSAEGFRQVAAEFVRTVPNATITTDVIAGFPGEAEFDFAQTMRLCEEMPLLRMHVFRFSPRPGTYAATLSQVAEPTKAKRVQRLLHLAKEKYSRSCSTLAGRSVPVLWERETKPGLWTGLTSNYIRVFCNSRKNLSGRITDVKLEQQQAGEKMWGRLAY